MAEFNTKLDPNRVLDGSPWMVGKHVVLLKNFDSNEQPLQVVFDRLTIWAHIMALPPRLMKTKLGMELAKPIGRIVRVDADVDGRCWGAFMRVRAEILVEEPLVRYVTVNSAKTKTIETFAVTYERMPSYCFSCGLLGHSSMLRRNPGTRDDNGDLPYAAKKLCAHDQSKRSSGPKSSNAASSSKFDQKQESGNAPSGDARTAGGWGRNAPQNREGNEDGEVSSPVKKGLSGRGRGRPSGSRGRGKIVGAGQRSKSSISGQKRKPTKIPTPVQDPAGLSSGSMDAMAIVVTESSSKVVDASPGVIDRGSNKKQRTTTSRSEDPAAAAVQPRQTQ